MLLHEVVIYYEFEASASFGHAPRLFQRFLLLALGEAHNFSSWRNWEVVEAGLH